MITNKKPRSTIQRNIEGFSIRVASHILKIEKKTNQIKVNLHSKQNLVPLKLLLSSS